MASSQSSVPASGLPAANATAPKKTMKRTSTAPWTAAVQGNRALGTSSAVDRSNIGRTRITSDVPGPRSPFAPAHGAMSVAVPKPSGFASSAKVQQLQKQWEQNQSKGDAVQTSPNSGAQSPREAPDEPQISGQNLTSTEVSKPTIASPVPLPGYASSAKRPASELGESQAGPSFKRQQPSSASKPQVPDQLSAELRHQFAKIADRILDDSSRISSLSGQASEQTPKPSSVNPSHESPRVPEATLATKQPNKLPTDKVRNLPTQVIVNGQTYNVIEWAGKRRYLDYHANDGSPPESSCGALLPVGYRTLPESEAIFVCPVHDCQKRLNTIRALGGHFAQAHGRRAFNDNMTGTISEVGFYNYKDFAKRPPVIISQNKLPPGAPPPAQPTMSYANMMRARLSTGRQEASDSEKSNKEPEERSFSPPAISAMPADATTPNTEALKYLHAFLHVQHATVKREDIDYMLQLPRLRDLPGDWLDFYQGNKLDANNYACALAYVVGDEVTGPKRCTQADTNKSKYTLRLSERCIQLPSSMPKELKEVFSKVPTCVGCRYWAHLQRQSNPCDWNPQRRQPGTKPKHPRSTTRRRKSLSDDGTGAESEDVPESPRSESEAAEEESSNGQGNIIGMTDRPESSFKARRNLAETNGGSIPAPRMFDDTMEDWEEAPGRLLIENTNKPLGIAYSNIYTASEHSVDIANDIGFNRVRLQPGKKHSWPADHQKIRSCEVIAGKIDCNIGDQSFTIGHGGLFVVHPGKSCMIHNHRYFEAIVSCHTISGYSFMAEL